MTRLLSIAYLYNLFFINYSELCFGVSAYPCFELPQSNENRMEIKFFDDFINKTFENKKSDFYTNLFAKKIYNHNGDSDIDIKAHLYKQIHEIDNNSLKIADNINKITIKVEDINGIHI